MTSSIVHQVARRNGPIVTARCGVTAKVPGALPAAGFSGWHHQVSCPACLHQERP